MPFYTLSTTMIANLKKGISQECYIQVQYRKSFSL